MTLRQTVPRAFLLLALSFVFLWPAVMNHGPFYFLDTRTYMRTEDAALSKFLHIHTDWTTDDSAAAPTSQQSDLAAHNWGESHSRSTSQVKQRGIVLGRSMFWGFLPYIGWKSNFWLTIFLQSTSLALLLWLCLRALNLPIWKYIFPIGVLLAILSDVAFYASYLMPDIYAGFSVISIAILLSAGAAITRRQYYLWFVVLTWCVLAHDSLVLLDAACLGAALLINLFLKDWKNRAGLVVLASSLGLALMFQQAIAIGIQHVTQQEPLRLPVLTARLIADGPGTAYLKKSCPASGFITCAYVDKLPISSSDFLYCITPRCAAYESEGYETRLRISKEQMHFFIAVLRDDPVAVVKADLKDTWTELLNLSMGPFLYTDGLRLGMNLTFPQSALAQIHNTAAYRGSWPVGLETLLVYIVTIISLLYIVLNSFGVLPGRDKHSMIVQLGLWCCAGVLLNAAICGCLSDASTENARYQGRVVWVLPLVVLFSEAIYRRRKNALLEQEHNQSQKLAVA